MDKPEFDGRVAKIVGLIVQLKHDIHRHETNADIAVELDYDLEEGWGKIQTALDEARQ
jgi:hypothetical protein